MRKIHTRLLESLRIDTEVTEGIEGLVDQMERQEYHTVLIDPVYLNDEDACLILETLSESGTRILTYESASRMQCEETVTTYKTVRDLKRLLMEMKSGESQEAS